MGHGSLPKLQRGLFAALITTKQRLRLWRLSSFAYGTGMMYVRETQAGMLTSPGDSAGIGLVFAAALMESETTQLAPANAMQMALPAQLK
jgi:hypothetical protein